MTKNLPIQWISEIYKYSGIFKDLQLVIGKSSLTQWPDCEQLMDFLEEELCSLSGKPISMVAQDKNLPFPHLSYEERIYQTGMVSTRENNWHDFFNAMIWVLFPQTKKLLNWLHIQELEHQKDSHRTQSRDAITHLDESGIIIVSSSSDLLDALKKHLWLEVFYQQQELWKDYNPSEQNSSQQIGAYIFGHGIYEKALNPFIGFTGKMYAMKVEQQFFSQNKLQQYVQLDQLLAKDIKNKKALKNNCHLSPLPVLGIPGWSELNKQKDFYLNENYFRPAKVK